jgi:hypothetical protein
MKAVVFVVACLISCSGSPPAPPAPKEPASAVSASWAVPVGWKSETIPFPLGFAPDIQHTGEEELRFPAGFLKPASTEYWSYTFIWRTTDPAVLDASALGDELTRYFRGLITAVDEGKQNVKDRDAIIARAVASGDSFELTAHVFDAFGTGQPVDLAGWAKRISCGSGAVWVFALAPGATSIRDQLDKLARTATCLPR